MPNSPSRIEIYERDVIRRGSDECWGWVGIDNGVGYGVIANNKKRILAHRFSYEQSFGNIPAGLEVMHRCHNPICTNPGHLMVGTRTENMQMSAVAGRLQRKIPVESMPQVFRDRVAGMTLEAIGGRFGCTKQAVRYMLNNHPEFSDG